MLRWRHNRFDHRNVRHIHPGTHLTQPTTANKPLVRRGMLNELLNSATPATQSVTCIAAPYTLALYGTGNVVLSGTGAGTLTGTGASDLVVLNFTPTAGSVTFTKAGTVSSFGLFKGTWTAAQILAEGGIPTTTATAASSPSAVNTGGASTVAMTACYPAISGLRMLARLLWRGG
jgi:hypothetical protein